jgi:isoamylase
MIGIEHGKSFPLGPTPVEGGVNFCVYSKRATAVEILLFDDLEAEEPGRVIALDVAEHRTANYWHAFVPGVGRGQAYGYRVDGPWAPGAGHRFDAEKLLLDPYARAVHVPARYDRDLCRGRGDTTSFAMRSVVTDCRDYDWEGDEHPRHHWRDTVIYEMHVAGFTKHPSSGLSEELRGTYRGVVEKIPYLKDLGVTAVELLPVYAYDAQDAPRGLTNYWGYSPVSFFAPHAAYARARHPCEVLDEFRDMVKALHRADIEVILDVVYNHSAEGGAEGPTISFRGLENRSYYITDDQTGAYLDFSGCGNTIRANQAVVQRMIMDSLEYWVHDMHVDGFRFDLASILSRDKRGDVLEDPPVLWRIDADPVLAPAKIIAEAWDAGGLEQVGRFVGDRWKEWNGRFRDDVRRFIRGDEDTVRPLRRRILASPDLYRHKARGPEESINFVTCHDGFTLNDLVTYARKHNEANGEDAGSGSDWDHSANYGVEGPTDDPVIEGIRNRQVKNFLATTLLAMGTPMLLMGDEVRRTQRGNNNAYCQDNEISWFDWGLLERHADVHRFVKRLMRIRLHLEPRGTRADRTLEELLEEGRVTWHGTKIGKPDFAPWSHSLALTVRSDVGPHALHAILNAFEDELSFELPPTPRGSTMRWHRMLDTNLPSPDDICEPGRGAPLDEDSYVAAGRSVVLLALTDRPDSIP